jgi:hypothetical protein
MKTRKVTIDLELPASTAAITAGLDRHQLWPPLAAAENAASEARERLETGRNHVHVLSVRVEHLALDVARGGPSADYEQALVRLRAAEGLIPAFERVFDFAEAQLRDARVNAAEACAAEARRRQGVLNKAGSTLLAELEKLDQLEHALAAHATTLPVVNGGGYVYPGSFRDQPPVAATR